MESIRSITSSDMSFYRTSHHFENYVEFCTVEQFNEYRNWAVEQNKKIYILGNGSNTLFIKNNIKSLVLKNKLNKCIKPLGENILEISSSTLVIDVLKYCYKNSLDSFYYLASVPATIGGALAMNAGRGRGQNLTIYDFVESVTYFNLENNCIETAKKEEIIKGYRETIFTGINSKLILSAVFKFDIRKFNNSPIVERLKWSKQFQDYTAPNCGSVFKQADFRILNKIKGIKIGKAGFSSKTANWIFNHSSSSVPIVSLIYLAKLLHFVLRKKAVLEVIFVD